MTQVTSSLTHQNFLRKVFNLRFDWRDLERPKIGQSLGFFEKYLEGLPISATYKRVPEESEINAIC